MVTLQNLRKQDLSIHTWHQQVEPFAIETLRPDEGSRWLTYSKDPCSGLDPTRCRLLPVEQRRYGDGYVR